MAGPRVPTLPAPGVPLEVRGLRVSYSGREVLRGLDLRVGPGEFVALLGANGSGKSTALRAVAGLQPADAGTVAAPGARPAMIFQRPSLVLRRTVLDNVCAGALGRLPLLRSLVFPDHVRRLAMGCLDRVGLADRARDRAGRLSGGQQQRVAIARALCQTSPLLLADEPVSALDPHAGDQVLALLAGLAHADGLAVLAVLHQPDLARRYADRVIGLRGGVAVLDLPAAQLRPADIGSLYEQDGP